MPRVLEFNSQYAIAVTAIRGHLWRNKVPPVEDKALSNYENAMIQGWEEIRAFRRFLAKSPRSAEYSEILNDFSIETD